MQSSYVWYRWQNSKMDWYFSMLSTAANDIKSDWDPFLSLVPQGASCCPLLSSLYISDTLDGDESEIRRFGDDCVYCREIHYIGNMSKLQKDIVRLGIWARNWSTRFHLSNITWYNWRGTCCIYLKGELLCLKMRRVSNTFYFSWCHNCYDLKLKTCQ